ncbi:conserved hypothetical protein [Ricinus communis]|uniref:Uncharacterized protein n=1 Tax=Ricinus communis TaxID=3988 RepID=B9SVZ2_RICCO|nr:conserved hypothetical protein [Ricinus communis]
MRHEARLVAGTMCGSEIVFRDNETVIGVLCSGETGTGWIVRWRDWLVARLVVVAIFGGETGYGWRCTVQDWLLVQFAIDLEK